MQARIDAALALEKEILSSVPPDAPEPSRKARAALSDSFAGGDGTEASPYIIKTPEQLASVAEDLTAYYQLGNDLDMKDVAFTPIGSPAAPFSGQFSGADCEIKNLSIRSDVTNTGLFGSIKNATIKNLTISSANISGTLQVGGLAGRADNSTITNILLDRCNVTGTLQVGGMIGISVKNTIRSCSGGSKVENSGDYTGGIIATMIEGTVANTYFSGIVTGGPSFTGGIIGSMVGNSITRCTNIGAVQGRDAVGGIAGQLSYPGRTGQIKDCYNMAYVSGENEVGGIGGYALTANDSDRINAIGNANAGPIAATDSFAGGIVGDSNSNLFVLAGYNVGGVSSSNTFGGIVGRMNQNSKYLSSIGSCYNAGIIGDDDMSGSIVGINNASSISNTFYLEGFAPPIGKNQSSGPAYITKVSAETLKGLADTLGNKFFETDTKEKNNGFPVLINVIYPSSLPKTFLYPGTGANKDTRETCFYDDAYFTKSSYDYNAHLATMSLCLELSAWNSRDAGEDYTKKSQNAEKLLKDIGFTGFEENEWFDQKPESDSIGAVAANKKLSVDGKEYTLIALAVRGGEYGSEWASNFTIGSEGYHQGFALARNNVLKFLNDYVQKTEITGDVKIWLVGYSRGAAVANLTAGALDDGVEITGCILKPENLYAYTFETPAGVFVGDAGDLIANDPKYDNIFNVINSSNPVPLVAPELWGFGRYGVDRRLPAASPTSSTYPEKLDKMKSCLAQLGNPISYVVDDFSMKKIQVDPENFLPGGKPLVLISNDDTQRLNQNLYLTKYVNILFGEFFGNRIIYSTHYQESIRSTLHVIFGSSESQTKVLVDSLTARFLVALPIILSELLIPDPTSDDFVKKALIYDSLSAVVEKSLSDAGITDYTHTQIQTATFLLTDLVFELARRHPNMLVTAVSNFEGIGTAHYPELCLAWLQSQDSNYADGAKPFFVSGDYRTVRINCPVDVAVYDERGTLTAAIKDDVPQDVGSSIISSVNEDGEKIVYLPPDAEYTIKITATGDGSMNYMIQEYGANAGGVTRTLQYNDVAIETGSEFTAVVPAYSDGELAGTGDTGSVSSYSLSDSSGQAIAPSQELVGRENAGATYKITVETNHVQRGRVEGYGSREVGSFAQVTATTYPGAIFDGWFENGEKVSSDEVYRFRVDRDRDLIAQFSGEQSPLTIGASAGGTIAAGENGTYELGTILDIAAKPDAGYRFVGWQSSNGGYFADETAEQTQFAMPYGETTVTAKFEPQSGNSLMLSRTELRMTPGSVATLDATASPGGEVNKDITWTSSDPKVATVTQQGLVRSVDVGTATITATTADGKNSATCTVYVQTEPIPVSGITISESEISVETGKTAALRASVSPDTATDQAVAWLTSDESVAAVDQSGLVTAARAGTATITATSHDGQYEAKCVVTVTDPAHAADTELVLSHAALTLSPDAVATVIATALPSGDVNKNIVWRSSDERVVTVTAEGGIRAVGAGNATITAATADGKLSASCEISVLT